MFAVGVVIAIALTPVPGGAVAGWQEQQCGFAALDPAASAPASLQSYLQEAERRPALSEPVRLLRKWFRGCDAGAARRAILALRQAVGRNRSDPLARLLLGAALARGPEVQVPGASGYLHRLTHHYSNSEREARRLLLAVASETSSPDAALELTALALATRHRESLEDAAASLHAVLRQRSEPELSVALAEVLLASGDAQGARQPATHALNAGDSRGQRALAIALMSSGGGIGEAGNLYLSALESANRATLALYFEDIEPLLTPAQVAEWNRLPEGESGAWLRREWEWRAATAGATAGERITEHHRRVAVAAEQYQRTANRGPRPEGALALGTEHTTSPFDDRGLVFIRHGEPAEVIRAAVGTSNMIREAWAYPGLGHGGSVFEFSKPPGYGDFVLTEPLHCDPFLYMFGEGGQRGEVVFENWVITKDRPAPAPPDKGNPRVRVDSILPVRFAFVAQAPTTGWQRWFEAVYLDYAASLGRYDQTLAVRGRNCLAAASGLEQTQPGEIRDRFVEISFLNDMNRVDEQLASRTVAEALATETGPRRFTAPLRVQLSLYEFLSGGAPELTAFTGIPGSDVAPLARGAEFDYGLRLSLALEDSRTRAVERVDTTLAFVMPRRLAGEDLVRTAISISYRTGGPRTVRVVIADGNDRSRGQILAAQKTLGIDTVGLALSDLVIAETRPGTWTRGQERLAPIPGHQVPAGSTFRLFHELYGARAGDPIRLQVVVSPGRGKDILARMKDLVSHRYAMSLGFDEIAVLDADGVARMTRDLSGDLHPGAYSLEVIVRNLRTGQTASRSTELFLAPAGGK